MQYKNKFFRFFSFPRNPDPLWVAIGAIKLGLAIVPHKGAGLQ